jgi:hypothetical protein
MIEHRAQRIAGAGVGGGLLDRFRDGQAERALAVRVSGQRGPPGIGEIGRAGEDLGPPGLHHRTPEGLLLVADIDHEDAHRQAEHLAGVGDGRAPLAGAGFGGQLCGAGQLVEVGLRHGRVRFVRAGRRDAFVLEENLGRRAQRPLQAQGPTERCRPPLGVDLANFFGNGDPALGRHFLFDNGVGKNCPHCLRRHRIAIRPERWRRRIGHVGDDVVPVSRNLFLFKIDADRCHIFISLSAVPAKR